MCKKVDCSHCGKPTWMGCGMHVQKALEEVPFEERCPNWPMGASKPCNFKHNTQVATSPPSPPPKTTTE